MNKVTKGLIDRLQTRAVGPAVTIYLSAHRSATSPHMHEDEIRFKNLAHRASGILDNINKHSSFNSFFADQSAQLLEDELFWKQRANSILICAQEGQFETYDLPVEIDEYTAVDDHYHLAPVYGLLEDSTPFYVLSVTKDEATLFKGDEYGLQLEARNSRSDKVNSEARHHPYFRRIDIEFFSKLDRSPPLILVGVSSDVSKYRSLSDYPHILDQSLSGSYGPDSANELFVAGWQIISQNVIEARHQERLANYQSLKGAQPELASDDLANIKDAAEYGRVDTLFIGMSRNTTDNVEDSVEASKKIIFPDEIESQVIDRLAHEVWGQHGHIINITEDQSPSPALLHAVYRY